MIIFIPFQSVKNSMKPREDIKLRQRLAVEGLYSTSELRKLQTSLARSARRDRRAAAAGKPQSSKQKPKPNAEIKKVPPELEALQNSQMQRHHKIKGGKRKDCPVKTLI